MVYGKYILMFTQPLTFFHKPQRWVMGFLGQLTK